MSQSKLMIGVVGLAIFILAPIQVSSSKIEDGNMETHIETRTEEVNQEALNEVELQKEVEFIGIQQEDKMEEVVVVEEVTYKEINCELTFYTDLASCNGDDLALTASMVKLNPMTVAVPRKQGSKKPVFPFGTKIYIEGIGERIVEDTGNPNYLKVKSDGTYILDVYVPRNKGEKDAAYKKRILAMGRVATTAKVYLEEEE